MYKINVYKIVNNINDEIYIGSTKNVLASRWMEHKRACKQYPERNGLYQMMNQHSFDCFRIVLVEEFEVENRQQQVQCEQKMIDEFKPTLNKLSAFGQLCEHNIIRCRCKDCGGSQICEHDKNKYYCKDCNGNGICEHNNYRHSCKDCGGSQICAHGINKSYCKDCSGAQICKHDKIKSRCTDCGGGSICEHGNIRSACKDCGGSQICRHNRYRHSCKDCGGSQICEHGISKNTCKKCGGNRICTHNIRVNYCKECSPVVCKHCNETHSKGNWVRHTKSKKHINNLNK